MGRRTTKSAKVAKSAKPAKPHTPPARQVRDLLRVATRGSLATSLPAAAYQAWPYASLVLVAAAEDGAPVLLLSDLSEHAKNIAADDRVSLLIDGTAGRKDPLTGPRVTLLGRAVQSKDAGLKARFLARHPAAKLYAGFGDFRLYRIEVTRAHFVAGFGRIHWIDAAEIIGKVFDRAVNRTRTPRRKGATPRRRAKAGTRRRVT